MASKPCPNVPQFPVRVHLIIDSEDPCLPLLRQCLRRNNTYLIHKNKQTAQTSLLNHRSVFESSQNKPPPIPALLSEQRQQAERFDFPFLRGLTQTKQRFEEQAVVVIDYSAKPFLPREFAKNIRTTFAKKIAIGTVTEYAEMLRDQKKGLFDYLLLKDPSCDFIGELNRLIEEGKLCYFSERMENRLGSTYRGEESEQLQTAFAPAFSLLSAYEIYPMDWAGSFLLLTQDASAFWCLVASKKSFQNYIQLIQDSGICSPNISAVLEQNRCIPFFLTEEQRQTPIDGWGPYLQEAFPLRGENRLFFSIKPCSDQYPVNEQGRLTSFAAYRRHFLHCYAGDPGVVAI